MPLFSAFAGLSSSASTLAGVPLFFFCFLLCLFQAAHTLASSCPEFWVEGHCSLHPSPCHQPLQAPGFNPLPFQAVASLQELAVFSTAA